MEMHQILLFPGTLRRAQLYARSQALRRRAALAHERDQAPRA